MECGCGLQTVTAHAQRVRSSAAAVSCKMLGLHFPEVCTKLLEGGYKQGVALLDDITEHCKKAADAFAEAKVIGSVCAPMSGLLRQSLPKHRWMDGTSELDFCAVV